MKVDNIMVLSEDGLAVAAAGQIPRGIMGFRGRVPKSSVTYGFIEEGCCVKDLVHERARLSAVVQCSGVCEATALAQRSGGQ